MTGRLVLLSLLMYGLLMLGLVTLNSGLVALALPLAVYLGSALVFGPAQVQLSATRELDTDTVSPGRPVIMTVRVTNTGKAIDELLIEDRLLEGLTLVSGETRLLAALPAGESLVLTYVLTGPRGSYKFREVQVTARDTLGIFGQQTSLYSPAHLLILPEVARLKRVPIRPLRTHGFAGPIPARQRGSGIDFFGVREYQLGDPLRAVNWRVTARHDQAMFTNEFEQERIADVGIILDARQQNEVITSEGTIFEYGVRAAAALAETFLKDGNRVGLLIYGRGMERTFPGTGKVQRERILRALARARTGSNMALENLEYLPTRFFPARSQIILISPLAADDLAVLTRLRAQGYSVLVVSPDPVSYESRTLKEDWNNDLGKRLARVERTLLLRNVQRVGIQVIDWQVDQPFNQAVQSAIGRLTQSLQQKRIAL